MSSSGKKNSSLAEILTLPGEIERYREMLLANVVMVGEIPAPTFEEEERIGFVKQRFKECGLQSSSSDAVGNALGILSGTEGENTILLCAHADTPFDSSENHTFTIGTETISGPGVADNSLGVAALVTLPTILEGLGIRFKNDLLLMASTRSLEQGNQQGIRFFLENTTKPINGAVLLEGYPLGRLHYRSMATLGGMISCNVDRKISQLSAIAVLNKLIYELGHIELCSETNTGCVLGSVRGGATYKLPARTAQLKFQLKSDTDESISVVEKKVRAIIDKAVRQEGVSAHLEVIARTRAGGLPSTHPLVSAARRVMRTIGIQPQQSIYSSTISPYLEHNIPAVCVGISNGENINYLDEYIEIDPLINGMTQIIGLLLCIDGGDCA